MPSDPPDPDPDPDPSTRTPAAESGDEPSTVPRYEASIRTLPPPPARHHGARLSFQPRIRKGAFFEAAWRHGCRTFSVYNRTYISSVFTDPVTEYWQVIKRVSLWPVMGERQVEISGPDAAQFVQLLTPRNMERCAVGQCKYALITAADGGILSDPIILRLAEDVFWLSTSDCDLELWAKGLAVYAGMDVTIRDADVSVLQVQGPHSPDTLAALFGDGMKALRYYRFARVDFAGTELIVSRTGWSGEYGYEIYLADRRKGDALFEALLEAGRPWGIAPGSVSQIRRIEAGILSCGVDATPSENPYEVGLGRLVEFDQPLPFVGREALERLSRQAPARQCVGLRLDAGQAMPNETSVPLASGRAVVGRLTSLAHSPTLRRDIALGLVSAEKATPGTALEVLLPEGTRTAEVCALPFISKRQTSPKAAAS